MLQQFLVACAAALCVISVLGIGIFGLILWRTEDPGMPDRQGENH